MADNRSQKIPFEIITDDGSISTDPKFVLQNWNQDFEKMYNLSASCRNEVNMQDFGNLNQSYADVSNVC